MKDQTISRQLTIKVCRTLLATLFGGLVLPAASSAVELHAPGKTEAQIQTEIVVRCHYQMGEFGAEAVNMCVKAEQDARKELKAYPDAYFDIVRRCNLAMYKAGWERIKLCAEGDIAADKALSEYAAEHAGLIAACRERVGRYGQEEVKKCVDEQIAATEDRG